MTTMTPTPVLVLASGSPRRAHMLRQIGTAFTVLVPEVDESLAPGEPGESAAERLARAKAAAVMKRVAGPVLAADTLVVCEGAVLGKPDSEEGARCMLRELAGRTHHVVTGVCVGASGRLVSDVERTEVTLSWLTDTEIDWYVATGEPLDKAGAYHIDGAGALFVEKVEGSASNVAGLPMSLARRLARAVGVALGPPSG